MSKLRIGIAATRRDTFPVPEEARKSWGRIKRRLKEILNRITEVECFWADDILEEGLMVELKDVDIIANYFRQNEIDALFIPHANFGQEEAVGGLCSMFRLPVLIWGPRDGSREEGVPFRKTDTQCGLFASTRVLLRQGIPFTYLENCWLDSPILDKGIEEFIRIACVVKTFRNLRVLQLSTRPRQFLSVKVNESELMERFGIQVVPLESSEILSCIDDILDNMKNQIGEWLQEQKQLVDMSVMTEEKQSKMAAIAIGIRRLAEKYRCKTVASECWSMFRKKYQIAPCYSFAVLSQNGLPVCCENDIHGAISSVLAQAATLFRTPSFLADITVRHPYNDNAELLWHCGPFPAVLAKDNARVVDAKGYYELKSGELTLVRFDTDHSNYYLFADRVHSTDGPETTGSYIWIETKNWPAWETKLMYGPYIHHIAAVYGDYRKVMKEACKYLWLQYDFVEA